MTSCKTVLSLAVWGKVRGWKRACALFLLCAATVIASPAQTFTNLIDFDGTNGEFPYFASLVQGTDGNFYGTTLLGGANTNTSFCNFGGSVNTCGEVFKITPSGALTTLYSFCAQSNCADGNNPFAGLVQSILGDFYGATGEGGANGYGTIFKVSSTGTLTTLHSFCAQTGCTDGYRPTGALVQATDGNLYGTTHYGGDLTCSDDFAYGCGTVFKIAPDGAMTTLHIFEGSDGSNPNGLVQATDGRLYGTTAIGGFYDEGTVFTITPSGGLTTLHSFDGSDGEAPQAALIQGKDGKFYGTTLISVFKITSAGALTTLYDFSGLVYSYAALTQATDRNFYGTTWNGGNRDKTCTVNGCGTIFKITPAGTVTTLHIFDAADGEQPCGALIQATDGNIYGMTSFGGTRNDGTVFSLSVALSPFVETRPTSGKVGLAVKILGSNLTGATSVTFKGTAATFTVVSPTLIKTTVPTGATTGSVQVATPSGTLTSNVVFRVRP